MSHLLEVTGLHTQFVTRGRRINAVDGVSFHVDRAEIVGVVGESGCGKSITALSILRLVPHPGRIVAGQIMFGTSAPKDVLAMSEDEICDFRGSEVGMVFQDPMTSLNPVQRIGDQIREAMSAHARFNRAEAQNRVVPLLMRVTIPSPGQRARQFPHQFSGGMRQRAMIAMGLSNEPALLIADEPTTALDVTVQAQIIELMRTLNRDLGTAIMLITHNLAVVASLCTRVIVMYAGRIVEQGPTREIFRAPQHPYTWSLLRSIPRIDRAADELLSISGQPPDLADAPPGCLFHPRCRFRISRCSVNEPPLENVTPAHSARCYVMMSNTLPQTRDR